MSCTKGKHKALEGAVSYQHVSIYSSSGIAIEVARAVIKLCVRCRLLYWEPEDGYRIVKKEMKRKKP